MPTPQKDITASGGEPTVDAAAAAAAAANLNLTAVNNDEDRSPPLPPPPPLPPTQPVATAAAAAANASETAPTAPTTAPVAAVGADCAGSVMSGVTNLTVGKPKEDERDTTPVETTARKTTKEKKKKGPKIGAGKRVWVRRSVLKYQVKEDNPARKLIDGQPRDDYRFYGVAKKGNNSNSWIVEFDMFPNGHKEYTITRKNIEVVAKGEEETTYNPLYMDVEETIEECETTTKKKKKTNPTKEAEEAFCSMSDDDIKLAKQFKYPYGEEPGDEIVWTILAEDEQITNDPMDHSTAKDVMKKDIEWHPDPTMNDYNSLFFDSFMVSLEGKAKVLDKYLNKSTLCPMYQTVQHDKIKFHQPEWEDPDQLLKLCITLMLSATLEVERGVENLFKRGKSNGFKDYPDYGQYVPENVFKAFMCGFPYLWCPEELWYKNPKDLPWDVVLPFVDEYNKKRTSIIRVLYLMLDESMSGWRPKTSKTGGLPNISHEPRKPVPLGTMIRNAVECCTGIFVNHDIVQRPEQQWEKEFCNVRSRLPQRENMPYATAEVLRQANDSLVVKGGWVGGDAFFGSIASVVELYLRFGVYSTFIVKQNLKYYPMKVLRAILLARHKQPAGKWVVMKATISGVELFIMAYAWSQKGIAYFVSSCGKTIQHEKFYISRYEDEYGMIQEKELPRPSIAHFLYEFLPLIDEHNKARQSILALERYWLTKDCWFRVLTTFIGMAFVDMMRFDRNKRAIRQDRGRNAEEDEDFRLRELVNYFAKPLRDGKFKCYPRKTECGRSRVMARDDPADMQPLVRIKNNEGDTKTSTGRSVNMSCFMCRRYQAKKVIVNWQCAKCGMPLCKQHRGREMSCLEEHLNSSDETLGCGYLKRKRTEFIMPSELRTYERAAAATNNPPVATPSPPKRARTT